MKSIKPISPEQIESGEITHIPDLVIAAFNELIVKNYSYGSARITQQEVINKIIELSGENSGITSKTIFEKKWLDVEIIFKKFGWKIEYDKPAYCESYEPYFIFNKK